MKKLLSLALLSIISTVGLSQSSTLGNWLIYFGNKQLGDRWNLHHEVQHRNYNALGDLEQLLLRTGIGYDLTENNNNVLLGYGFIHSQNYIVNSDEKIEVDEHRIFQQFITRQNFGRVGLQHRYRFEQRWIENRDFKLRFRYFLSINMALSNPRMEDKTFYLSAYNEIFINNQNVLFDRNRLYGGLGYRLSRLVRFELGYMNQFLNNGGRDQVNVITFLNF